jgi:protein SCO1/2
MAVGLAVVGMQALIMADATALPASMQARSSLHRYVVPATTLIDQHSAQVQLDKALDSDGPVLVQFFFATCTTICGVRSAQLVAAAPKLAKDHIPIAFYTISIDPDCDTPDKLLAYAKQFGSPPSNWHLLTGDAEAIKHVQAAMDASDPSDDKMMHEPLTFIRGGKGKPWLRYNGLTTTDQLVQLVKVAMAAR